MTRHPPRGSALLIATIAMIIIAVIGVALVRFTQRELAGASAGARRQALVACAEAARGLLQSQFHALGTEPKDITLLGSDGAYLDGPGGQLKALGGHIGQDPAVDLTIKQVEEIPETALGPQRIVLETSNRITKGHGLGGAPLKVTVHCQQGDFSDANSGRQLELEFGVRFGL